MVINLLEVFRIGEKVMSVDGWILWGWIAIVAYSFFKRPDEDLSQSSKLALLSRLILPIAAGSYLVFFSIMSGHSKGWYRFPFYPFLSWASAALFIEIFKNPRFLSTFFFISIPFFSSYIYGSGEYKWDNNQIKLFQLSFVLLMTIPIMYEIINKPKLRTAVRVILILAFGLAIIYNIRTIQLFQDQFWY